MSAALITSILADWHRDGDAVGQRGAKACRNLIPLACATTGASRKMSHEPDSITARVEALERLSDGVQVPRLLYGRAALLERLLREERKGPIGPCLERGYWRSRRGIWASTSPRTGTEGS
jgi:hypothetical protein